MLVKHGSGQLAHMMCSQLFQLLLFLLVPLIISELPLQIILALKNECWHRLRRPGELPGGWNRWPELPQAMGSRPSPATAFRASGLRRSPHRRAPLCHPCSTRSLSSGPQTPCCWLLQQRRGSMVMGCSHGLLLRRRWSSRLPLASLRRILERRPWGKKSEDSRSFWKPLCLVLGEESGFVLSRGLNWWLYARILNAFLGKGSLATD